MRITTAWIWVGSKNIRPPYNHAVECAAEKFRVLDSRGFESSAAVGDLPESEQRVVIVTILQRELGVMVLAALVILVLLIRAAGTGG